MAALQGAVCAALPNLGSVLVKGSRFMKMEQVMQALAASVEAAAPTPVSAAAVAAATSSPSSPAGAAGAAC